MSLLLLNEDELRQTITITEAIDTVEKAFAASAEGRLRLPGAFTLNLPEVKGEVEVKGIYMQEAPYYVVKIGSRFLDNPTISLPSRSGLLAVFDAATGFPAAIMVDNGYLTNIRAGAVGALAARYLANQDIACVAVIGSGDQAYIQLKALMTVRDISFVLIWDRSPLNADNYVHQMMEDHDLNIQIAPSLKAAIQQADLVITATASQRPFLKARWLKPGVHITAVGSNTATKQELYPDVLQRANVVIVDSLEQSAIQGEVYHALNSRALNQNDIQGELGSLIIGKIPGRIHKDQITVADLTGLDSQDTALATLAMEKALFFGLGQRVELGLGQKGLNSSVESSL
jgi:ornithine cyclodeaminase